MSKVDYQNKVLPNFFSTDRFGPFV